MSIFFISIVSLMIWFSTILRLIKRQIKVSDKMYVQHKISMLYYMVLTILLGGILNFPLLVTLLASIMVMCLMGSASPVFIQDENSTLVVVPSITGRSVHIHFRDMSESFSRAHYKDLKSLLNKLHQCQIDQIKLTSPMFVKSGEMRNIQFLEKSLNDNWEISWATRPWWMHPLPVIEMAVKKHVYSNDSLNKLAINQWSRITLNRRIREK